MISVLGTALSVNAPLVYIPTSWIYLRREEGRHALFDPFKVTLFTIVEYVFFSIQAEIHELFIDLKNLSICKTKSLPIN